MTNEQEGNTAPIGGKITIWVYARLMNILKKKGITKYQMIQNVCESFVRYMDDKHNLTPESEKVMSIFEHMIGWKDNFNLADPTAKPEIAEATYYLTSDGKKNVRVLHVERPFFGTWKQTFNVQQILERFMCLTFPQLYRRLRFIAVCRHCSSLLELLTEVVCELEEEEKKRELLEDFEDAERSEWGKQMADRPFKRNYTKGMGQLFEDVIE